LQEDEGVVLWHRQQTGCQISSKEEVAWHHKSPSALLVNLEDDCVEGGLSMLDLHDFKSFAHYSHQKDWYNKREDQNDIGYNSGHFSKLCGLVSFNKLHDGEKCQIKVGKHVESNVDIELELSKNASKNLTTSSLL